jgi:hypothetical protein
VNCWAILIRPLRGLDRQLLFVQSPRISFAEII